MANLELSWYKPRKCWKKQYRGKVYYVSKAGEAKGPDDRRGYEAALLNWLNLKARIDGEAKPRPSVDPQTVNPVRPAVDPLTGKPLEGAALASFYDSVTVPTAVSPRKREYSLAEVVEAYLKERRRQAESGGRSISTFREARDKLNDFLGFAAKAKRAGMVEIDAHFLRHYRDITLTFPPFKRSDGAKGKPISPATAQKRLKYVRMLMEWAYREEYVETLPRNLDKTFTEVKLPDPKPMVFSREEVRELFSYCSQRTKLYFALALNCGYGQTDIATLTHKELDTDKWEIHRKRHKTGAPQHHSLWGVTMELLLREMTDPKDSELALLTADGKPLVVESMDGTTAKTDPIGRSFDRARKRADYHREKKELKKRWNGGRKGIKYLRKTGAQFIEDNYPETPHIVKQYLGHKEGDVAKHYRKQNYELLFKALEAMDTHFGLLELIEV